MKRIEKKLKEGERPRKRREPQEGEKDGEYETQEFGCVLWMLLGPNEGDGLGGGGRGRRRRGGRDRANHTDESNISLEDTVQRESERKGAGWWGRRLEVGRFGWLAEWRRVLRGA